MIGGYVAPYIQKLGGKLTHLGGAAGCWSGRAPQNIDKKSLEILSSAHKQSA